MTTEKARVYATKAHEGQVRKSTGNPMIEHPIRVAQQLKEAGFSEAVQMAGYLHDTVEDTWVTFEDIEREFGKEVLEIVKGNTEDKEKSWEERKQHTIDSIKDASLDIKALIVADKYDNLTSLVEDYEKVGEKVWDVFKRGKEKQKWYFSSVATNAYIGLSPNEIPVFFHDYQQLVKEFFN